MIFENSFFSKFYYACCDSSCAYENNFEAVNMCSVTYFNGRYLDDFCVS